MSRVNSKKLVVKQRLWEFLKAGFASEEFTLSDLGDIQFGAGYSFGEYFDECIFRKAENIWGSLEGFDELGMDLGTFIEKYFDKKLDPVSELIMTKFVPINLGDREITRVNLATDDWYDGFREYYGEPRHHFNLGTTSRSKNGRMVHGSATFVYVGINSNFDSAIMEQILSDDPDLDGLDDIVSKMFDWTEFELRLSTIARTVLSSHMEMVAKELEKKKKFSEDLETYQKLQVKLKKAGVI